MPGLFYADNLVLCGKSEEDLNPMVGRFVEIYRRRSLKVNAGKGKLLVLSKEEELESEFRVDGIR